MSRDLARVVAEIAEIERLAVNLAMVTRLTPDEALTAASESAAASGRRVEDELRRMYTQACAGGRT